MSQLPRLVFYRFASCGGCQLTLLNCEDQLGALAKIVNLVGFPLVSSLADDQGAVDVALVEGSVASPQQADVLLVLRQRATFLVAVGSCALTGGINRLGRQRQQGQALGCPQRPGREFLPQPLSWLVSVDLEIPGCPPEGGELLAAIGALLHSGKPATIDYPVCMECHMREQLCLLHERRMPCLGAVTRGGCGARCPAAGVVCEGCRGRVQEANLDALRTLLLTTGLDQHAISARLERFAGGGA